ncbi:hypothetical protein DVH24_008739 [Malus domestica]|uniref:RNase H type-1 domain-containing protein n=1 Tax=Malus domestica TaxID=3750 RepID=A0A498JMD9_MALDO|nr:hypothetical protein DVH24_008739 [Malus domestica]
MKESSDGFVRADQIDLKSLDEQLERHLNRVLTLEKNKIMRDPETNSNSIHLTTTSNSNSTTTTTTTSTSSMTLSIPRRHRQEWEIDPSKLLIKSVIARGTVHRGNYDGQDVTEGHRTDSEIASLRAAFTQEVAVWQKLDHPNVTKAALLAVRSAIHNNFLDVIFKSDSLELISNIKGDFKNGNWTIFPLLIQIRNLFHRFHSVSWRWIPRQANCAADWVASYCKRGMRSDFIGATMGSSDLQIQTENGQIGMPTNICCVIVEYLPGGALKSYLIKQFIYTLWLSSKVCDL